MKLKFNSISEQVAEALRGEIRAKTWNSILPGERQLAHRFQVSRKTLRRALAELRADGMLTTRGSCASFIKSTRSRPQTSNRIALLFPNSLEDARPYTVLWVNRLMAMLHDRGLHLEVFHGAKYYGSRAGQSLSRLTTIHPARCWILARSTPPMQEWFATVGIPTLVSGSTHFGVNLPSVDIDHRALCRHAASYLLRNGHRRVAIFLDRTGQAGDVESEAGFIEGASSFGTRALVVARRIGSDQSTANTIRQLRTLLATTPMPTGWLLSNSHLYLTVVSYLGYSGLRIPEDISLVCRDEEPFLQYLHPTPVRYTVNPIKFATRVNRALKRIDDGETGAFSLRLMPELIDGGSVRSILSAG